MSHVSHTISQSIIPCPSQSHHVPVSRTVSQSVILWPSQSHRVPVSHTLSQSVTPCPTSHTVFQSFTPCPTQSPVFQSHRVPVSHTMSHLVTRISVTLYPVNHTNSQSLRVLVDVTLPLAVIMLSRECRHPCTYSVPVTWPHEVTIMSCSPSV